MSTIKVNTIQDASGGNASTAEQINQGRVKVWVNFDGSGTISIRDSFNVSSVTDEGTGQYEINFSNALGNANYAVATSGFNTLNSDGGWVATSAGTSEWASNADISTTRVRIASFVSTSGQHQDGDAFGIIICGD
jgi:hypothetical protein|tara:strand:- start:276 stop:680 length:405 start_codon:yes stop_codon:yes gene_type:complete